MVSLSPDNARRLADRLDALPQENFAVWKGGRRPDGTVQMPFPVYHPIEREWSDAVEGFGVPSPSQAYGRIMRDELPAISSQAIADADLEALYGYATFIKRGERFCDGHIESRHKQGFLSAVLRRYADLVERDRI